MTRVGNYQISKTAVGSFTLTTVEGKAVGTFPTARAANAEALRLTAAAYKAHG